MGPARRLLPAFVVGQGVLDRDPVGGVLVAVAFPLLDSAGQCSRTRSSWWCDCLPAVVAAQADLAVVQEDLDVGEVLEADGDALGGGCRGIVHTTRPQGVGPSRTAPPVSNDGGLHGVLLLLPGNERALSAAAGRRPADLDLGGIQPQLDILGLGVGEHVSQCPKARVKAVGDRTPPLGQENTYICDRTSDGGAVHAEQQPQYRVRQIVAADGSAWPPAGRRRPTGGGRRLLRPASWLHRAQHGDAPRPRPATAPPTPRPDERDAAESPVNS